VYFDPTKVGSYGGTETLRRVPRKIVEEWLSEQNVCTLYKPTRTRFKRRRVLVSGRNQQWQGDLGGVSSLKTENVVLTHGDRRVLESRPVGFAEKQVVDIFGENTRHLPMTTNR